MIGQGAKGSDGTKVRTWVGILRFVIAPREPAAMPGTRSAQPIVASGLPTAPTGRIHDRSLTTRQRRQKPLAQQGPSIQDEFLGICPAMPAGEFDMLKSSEQIKDHVALFKVCNSGHG